MVVTFKRGDIVYNRKHMDFGIVHRLNTDTVLVIDFSGFVNRFPRSDLCRAVVNFAGYVVLWNPRP